MPLSCSRRLTFSWPVRLLLRKSVTYYLCCAYLEGILLYICCSQCQVCNFVVVCCHRDHCSSVWSWCCATYIHVLEILLYSLCFEFQGLSLFTGATWPTGEWLHWHWRGPLTETSATRDHSRHEEVCLLSRAPCYYSGETKTAGEQAQAADHLRCTTAHHQRILLAIAIVAEHARWERDSCQGNGVGGGTGRAWGISGRSWSGCLYNCTFYDVRIDSYSKLIVIWGFWLAKHNTWLYYLVFLKAFIHVGHVLRFKQLHFTCITCMSVCYSLHNLTFFVTTVTAEIVWWFLWGSYCWGIWSWGSGWGLWTHHGWHWGTGGVHTATISGGKNCCIQDQQSRRLWNFIIIINLLIGNVIVAASRQYICFQVLDVTLFW